MNTEELYPHIHHTAPKSSHPALGGLPWSWMVISAYKALLWLHGSYFISDPQSSNRTLRLSRLDGSLESIEKLRKSYFDGKHSHRCGSTHSCSTSWHRQPTDNGDNQYLQSLYLACGAAHIPLFRCMQIALLAGVAASALAIPSIETVHLVDSWWEVCSMQYAAIWLWL